MTTIAYDGKQVACDSQVGNQYTIKKGFVNKTVAIYNHPTVWCAGGSGERDTILAFQEWMLAVDEPYPELCKERSAESTFFSIGLNGFIYEYERRSTPCVELVSPWACGSGSEYALGAMDAGASAKEAVEIAMQRDPNTGGKIVVTPFPVSEINARN